MFIGLLNLLFCEECIQVSSHISFFKKLNLLGGLNLLNMCSFTVIYVVNIFDSVACLLILLKIF